MSFYIRWCLDDKKNVTKETIKNAINFVFKDIKNFIAYLFEKTNNNLCENNYNYYIIYFSKKEEKYYLKWEKIKNIVKSFGYKPGLISYYVFKYYLENNNKKY